MRSLLRGERGRGAIVPVYLHRQFRGSTGRFCCYDPGVDVPTPAHARSFRTRLMKPAAADDNNTGGYVGRSILRREDRRLLTGRGQFVDDLKLADALHAVFVRSQLAHARIRSVDLTQALKAPGVVYALSGADLMKILPPVPDTQLSLPRKWTTEVQHTFLNPQQPLLAHDKVRHVGA